MFYSGGLQAGISLAVTEGKAVVCFVRDDEEASSVWEDEYFKDDEQFARLLETRSVLLRLTKGSDEAGFLTSFCPIVRFPAVVVIKNGLLREYLVPEISKDDFRSRLRAALDDTQSTTQNVPQNTSSPSPASSSASAPVPAPAPTVTAEPAPTPTSALSETEKGQPEASGTRQPKHHQQDHDPSPEQTQEAPAKAAGSDRAPQPTRKNQQSKREQQVRQYVANIRKQSIVEPEKDTLSSPAADTGSGVGPSREASTPRQPSPPKQYRLQVRLFDGSSVRNSFAPTQTIRGDVRPWLDGLLQDEKRPYNLKHILTPLPSRTLTIADEERTLEDLGLGSTANLVMIPINSYTEAYNSSGSSLPVRAAYSAYGLLSSAVGTATGLVGSFIGYNPAPSESSGSAPTTSSSSGNGARSQQPAASRGPRIRTLRDQREEQNDSQLYNGNQLNFEPRRDTDGQ
ncbi:UBX domain protein [Aspergillus lentulus]|uniref:UBX domain protein n=1 Tax=Aspergillus lentulus TaxID=293939 RepID=UPI001392CFF7|nr:UBX domain protein [Aspergillus lentulus]GFF45710.1 UBX domain protein [Aspergillus lentulus]GFF83493.1 UBX domain protein [Aspergillus lentulus]